MVERKRYTSHAGIKTHVIFQWLGREEPGPTFLYTRD